MKRGAFASHHASTFISQGDERIVSVFSTLLGILLWGYGTFWWAFACIAIAHDGTRNGKALLRWDQHLAAWSLVFPWVRHSGIKFERRDADCDRACIQMLPLSSGQCCHRRHSTSGRRFSHYC